MDWAVQFLNQEGNICLFSERPTQIQGQLGGKSSFEKIESPADGLMNQTNRYEKMLNQ